MREREEGLQKTKVPALDEIEVVHAFPFATQNVSRFQRNELEGRRQPVEISLPESLEEGHGPKEALCAPDSWIVLIVQPPTGSVGVCFAKKKGHFAEGGGTGDGERRGRGKAGTGGEPSSKKVASYDCVEQKSRYGGVYLKVCGGKYIYYSAVRMWVMTTHLHVAFVYQIKKRMRMTASKTPT